MASVARTATARTLRVAHLTVVDTRCRIVWFFRCRIVDPYPPIADFDSIGLDVGRLGVLDAIEVNEAKSTGTAGLLGVRTEAVERD